MDLKLEVAANIAQKLKIEKRIVEKRKNCYAENFKRIQPEPKKVSTRAKDRKNIYIKMVGKVKFLQEMTIRFRKNVIFASESYKYLRI